MRAVVVLAGFLAFLCAAAPARAQLLSHWTFDETSGTTAFDSVGAIHGTLEGGATFMPGQGILGGAIALDPATDSLVNMGNNYGFAGASFSLVAWVRLSPGDTLRGIPVARHRSGVSQGYFLAVNDVADGLGASAVNKAHFWAGSTPPSFTPPSSIVVNDGNWHQIVGTFNGGTNLKELYVDGVFQTSATHSAVASAAAAFMVGGIDVAGNPTGDFRGLVDDVRVYGNVLSAAEVSQLYFSAIPEPGTVVLCALGLAGAAGGGWKARRRRSRTAKK